VQNKQNLSALGLALIGAASAAAAPTLAASPAAKGAGKTTRPVPGINRVTGLEISSDIKGTHIVIEGSAPFTPDVRAMGRPSATVIVVPGRWNAGRPGLTSVRRNGVWNVRYGQFAAGAVRIVANTRQNLPCTAQPSSDRKRWEVTMWAPGVSPKSASKKAAAAVKPIAAAAAAPVATPQGEPSVSAASLAATVAPTPAAFTPVKANVTTAAAPVAALAAPVSAARPRPAAARRGFAVEQNVDSALRRVSLDFVAADINDVLKALSMQSGVNIVTGADVKGTITVTLKQVSLGDALDMVTRLSGFKYARFGPAYVVGTPASVASIIGTDGDKAEPVTEFIAYRYNTQANLNRALGDRFPELKLPAALDKEADVPSRPKTLVVTASPSRAAEVREFVEKLEQAVSVPTTNAATEVYRVRYASAPDLITILGRLVPTLSVQLGPSQGFVSGSSGASAAYSAAPATGAAGGAAGGATAGASVGGAGGGGTANPVGAQASGNLPNTILLSGATADIVRAREILTQVDVRVPQLQFEARVMDINRDDSRQLGIRYNFSQPVGIGEANFQKQGTQGGVVAPANPLTTARDLSFGAIYRTPFGITANLDALENNNRARTLANPSLAALDGQPAAVFIGDQIKYVINIQQTPQGQNVTTETALVGITLKVTGRSSPDGTITLYVHPEVSSISSYLPLANGISLPQIASRYVDTTIRVKDGETVAIGGLIQEADIRNIQKVPFLGDLPFFGQLLFRSTNTTKRKSEVVVFITSRISRD
jgi:type II secretory pathway component GspD/PulD (secretin)